MTGAAFAITDDRRRSTVAGTAAAPSSPPPSGNVGATRNKEPAPSSSSSRVKGKMPAAYDSPPRSSGKLMVDAIRCSRKQETSSKKRKDRCSAFWFGTGPDGQFTSSAGSDLPVSLSALPVATAHLRAALRDLGVLTDPVRVYGKMMSCSDRVTQQSRLLMSCKSWRAAADGPFPVDAFLTGPEKAAARGREGLEVLALDRDGDAYAGMRCKYLDSNAGYRVIGQWGAFLRRNGLVVGKESRPVNDVMVDLWMFRAAGRVGIVFVHYQKGDAAHADAAFEEEMGRPPRKARKNRRGASMEDADSSALEEEDQGAGAGNMKDALKEEEITLPFSDAIGAKASQESRTGSKGKTAVSTLPSHQAADGANEGKASPNADDRTEAAEVVFAPLSWDAGANEDDETAARGMPPEPLPLSSCKQEVLEAARTLMQISRGF